MLYVLLQIVLYVKPRPRPRKNLVHNQEAGAG